MLVKRILIIGIIILFLGVSVQPAIATVEPRKEIDIGKKDYLFQTIIDVANNPKVKKLLEQYDNDLFKVNINRDVYSKLLLRNPKLMFNTFFNKPSLSIEYLEKCYISGIEIRNIIGTDKEFEIIESIELSNTKLFIDLDNIIKGSEKLSDSLKILTEMNNIYEIFCSILFLIFIPALVSHEFFSFIFFLNQDSLLWSIIFFLPIFVFGTIAIISLFLLGKFDCLTYPYTINE